VVARTIKIGVFVDLRRELFEFVRHSGTNFRRGPWLCREVWQKLFPQQSSRCDTWQTRYFQETQTVVRCWTMQSVTARLVSLPVAGQSIVFSSTKIELNSVEEHSQSQIEPAPDVASSISSLSRPPLAIPAIAAGGIEMLHQETCIDRYQDRRTEPACKTNDLANLITIFQCRFL